MKAVKQVPAKDSLRIIEETYGKERPILLEHTRDLCRQIAKEQREICVKHWLAVDRIKFTSHADFNDAELEAITNAPEPDL